MGIELLFVGIGGSIGSICRFLLTKLAIYLGFVFPLGTLVSNVLAGILVGLVFGVEKQLGFSPRVILMIRTGFLGGLSTFSTFSFETVHLAQRGLYGEAGLNIALNLILSLAGVLLGLHLAKTYLLTTG
ncbi:MAG: fluoride efflux transporter CrcB [Deltaproteobacteria bacterium]|nr:fluoride efflux transporter CrcB [Deltaproteobacteria bacterium]